MIWLRQGDYPELTFTHRLRQGGVETNVAKSGCGLCSLCMVVDGLTTQTLSLEECVRLYNESGAGIGVGTNMKILGPVVAERFDLGYAETNDAQELAEWLRRGGMAVIHVGGDREGHVGLFSHGGHYVAAVSCDGDELCILDPSYRPDKFDEEGRQGKVRTDGAPFVYCSLSDALEDTLNRDPHFHLFRRK